MSSDDRTSPVARGLDPAPSSDRSTGEAPVAPREREEAPPSPFLGDEGSPAGRPTEDYTSAAIEPEQDARNDSG